VQHRKVHSDQQRGQHEDAKANPLTAPRARWWHLLIRRKLYVVYRQVKSSRRCPIALSTNERTFYIFWGWSRPMSSISFEDFGWISLANLLRRFSEGRTMSQRVCAPEKTRPLDAPVA
jgi:hypothetical protein